MQRKSLPAGIGIVALFSVAALGATENHAPVVSNVTAAQRNDGTNLVDSRSIMQPGYYSILCSASNCHLIRYIVPPWSTTCLEGLCGCAENTVIPVHACLPKWCGFRSGAGE